MISRLSSQLRLTRQALLSLALLPVFLWGTLPHIACICADGHREEHCRALSGQVRALRSATSTKCSCCQSRNGARSCCQTAKHERQSPTNLIASGSCCHPIVESPAPLVLTGKIQPPTKATLVAAIAPLAEFDTAPTNHALRQWHRLSTPPPLDVVIVYLHLTI